STAGSRCGDGLRCTATLERQILIRGPVRCWRSPMNSDNFSPHRCLRVFALLLCALFAWPAVAQNGVDFARQAVQIAMTGEPRNLNSIRATDQLSIFYLEHVKEGLLRKNARNELVGGVAERWEMEGTH